MQTLTVNSCCWHLARLVETHTRRLTRRGKDVSNDFEECSKPVLDLRRMVEATFFEDCLIVLEFALEFNHSMKLTTSTANIAQPSHVRRRVEIGCTTRTTSHQ